MGHPQIKSEEVGTVYALIKGAKAQVVNHQGCDLGESFLDVTQRYELLASSDKLVQSLIQLIHNQS